MEIGGQQQGARGERRGPFEWPASAEADNEGDHSADDADPGRPGRPAVLERVPEVARVENLKHDPDRQREWYERPADEPGEDADPTGERERERDVPREPP